jgi:competence protein ComEC
MSAASRLPALVAALAWCGAIAAAVVLLPSQPFAGAIAVALALPVAALAFVTRPAIVALALAAALLGVGRAELPATDLHAAERAIAVAGHTAVIAGRVADDSRAAAGGAEVLIEPGEVLVDGARVTDIGNLMVRWRGPVVVAYGDEVQATGRLVLPKDLPTFNRRAYFAQRNAYLELQATSFDVTGAASGLLRVAATIRAWFTSAVDASMPAPHSAVLLGVVLGVRQGIPADLQNALIATGLVHLLVLSGLKVAVFARIAQGAMRPLLGRHATWPALVLIGMYALVGGATPAAVRASLMGGLAIVAQRLGRPAHVWTSLALTAAAMLGWRPELAWDVGFQLSFAGTAAIILLTPGIERRLPWMPQFVREPFAVTCAAQVGTLPMMATDFHLLSPVGPVANAIVLPVLPALVVAGLVLGPLSVLPDLARVVAIPVAGVLAYLEQVAYLLARVPAAAVSIPRFPDWAGLAYYAGIGPGIAAGHARGRARRIALLSAVGAPVLIAATAIAMWMEEPAQASVLAVGTGQAVLLRGPGGTILIDAGPSPGRLQDDLGQLIPPWQRRLNAIVVTAPTRGHVGGFAGFDRAVDAVLLPDVQFPGTVWRTTALEAAARGARVERLLAGEAVAIAGFRLEVLAPESGAPGEVIGAADLGLRVVSPSGRSFCYLSDLDVDAQAVAAARLRGTCTYVLLPNGGQTALSVDMNQAIGQPELLASLASGRLAAGLPPTVLRTDQEGTITVPM